MDTLATAFHVAADDLLRHIFERVPYWPWNSIGLSITDMEVRAFALMQALLGFTSEARWLHLAKENYLGMFPYLPAIPAITSACAGSGAALTGLLVP